MVRARNSPLRVLPTVSSYEPKYFVENNQELARQQISKNEQLGTLSSLWEFIKNLGLRYHSAPNCYSCAEEWWKLQQ